MLIYLSIPINLISHSSGSFFVVLIIAPSLGIDLSLITWDLSLLSWMGNFHQSVPRLPYAVSIPVSSSPMGALQGDHSSGQKHGMNKHLLVTLL